MSGRIYEFGELVGRGGFGEVFRGSLLGPSGFAKVVAIKVLNADAAEVAEIAQRLRDEARILALLRHRAIVHVEDLVQLEGRWAVIMEFVTGVDLGALVAQGPLPARPICEIGVEVAGALFAAHEALDPATRAPMQIVHRDIKPANIRLSPKGEVKVLDFGIARAQFGRREAKTEAGALGSMGYIAPERFELNDTPAADIYALGVVTIEAVLGRTVGQLSVDHRRQKNQVDSLLVEAQRDRGASRGLTDLIAAMLAYDLDERPKAHAVEDAFQDLIVDASGPWLKRWAPDAVARAAAVAKSPPEGTQSSLLRATLPQPGSAPLRVEIDSSDATAFARVLPPPPDVPRPVPLRAPAPIALAEASAVSTATPVTARATGPVSAGIELPNPGSKVALLALLGFGLTLGLVAGLGWLLWSRLKPEAPPVPEPVAVAPLAIAPLAPVVAVEVSPAPQPSPELAPPPVAPEPVVAVAPPQAPAAPVVAPRKAAPMGSVEVSGDHASVAFIDSAGKRHAAGPLAPGVYQVRARFKDEAGKVLNEILTAATVTVQANQTSKVACDAIAQNCRAL